MFAGYDFAKEWEKTHKPDVIFLVYNDHATAFSLQMIPTFAIITGPEVNRADEGYGAGPAPRVIGDPETCVLYRLGDDPAGFRADHGQRDRGRSRPHGAAGCVFGEVDAWPCKIVPFAVNVVPLSFDIDVGAHGCPCSIVYPAKETVC